MLQVFLHAATWLLFLWPWQVRLVHGLLVELAAFAVATATFVAAHALGRAGAGAGAGLRLAAVALAGRIACATYLGTWGFDTRESVYDEWPVLRPWVWLVRNVGLVAFAYGLALTLFGVLADAVRRRRHPAWVASLED